MNIVLFIVIFGFLGIVLLDLTTTIYAAWNNYKDNPEPLESGEQILVKQLDSKPEPKPEPKPPIYSQDVKLRFRQVFQIRNISDAAITPSFVREYLTKRGIEFNEINGYVGRPFWLEVNKLLESRFPQSLEYIDK